jgi:hypothetical protein
VFIVSDESEAYRRYCDSRSGVYPPEEFAGLWIEYWPDGSLKYRGQFQSGQKRIGQHISFFENGVLDELSFWDEGWVCGTLIWFREDGSKECEMDYGEYGGRTRCWVERSYGIENDLWKVTVWEANRPHAEWKHPELRKIDAEIDFDKIVNDAVKQVYPDESNG